MNLYSICGTTTSLLTTTNFIALGIRLIWYFFVLCHLRLNLGITLYHPLCEQSWFAMWPYHCSFIMLCGNSADLWFIASFISIQFQYHNVAHHQLPHFCLTSSITINMLLVILLLLYHFQYWYQCVSSCFTSSIAINLSAVVHFQYCN